MAEGMKRNGEVYKVDTFSFLIFKILLPLIRSSKTYLSKTVTEPTIT